VPSSFWPPVPGWLRQGECFGLPLVNWDRGAGQLQVTQQVKYLPGKGRFLAPPKTPASRRTLPVPDVVRKALAAHILRFPVGERGLIFTAEGDQLLDRNAFNATWRKAVAAVGLPKGTGFHDLRHYYASLLIAGGASVKVVQARLGHKSALETLDTYGHLWPDSDDLTRRAIDGVLGADGGAINAEEIAQ
jgi:integrase